MFAEDRAIYPATLEYLPPDQPLETRRRDSGDSFYRGKGGYVAGSFVYGKLATVRDRGRRRKERIKSGAFSYTVDDPDARIELLRGHSYDKPIASRSAGTLLLEDTGEALKFWAKLPAPGEQPTWITDTIKALRARLLTGVSPGFRIPPANVVPNAVRYVQETGNPDVEIREISAAVLYELSLVTRPAYTETTLGILESLDRRSDDLAAARARKIEERARLWL